MLHKFYYNIFSNVEKERCDDICDMMTKKNYKAKSLSFEFTLLHNS